MRSGIRGLLMFMRSFKLLLLKLVKDVISHGFKEIAMALRLNALLQALTSQGFGVNHAVFEDLFLVKRRLNNCLNYFQLMKKLKRIFVIMSQNIRVK